MTKDDALKLARGVLGEDRAWLESDAPQRVWDANSNAMIAIDEALAQPVATVLPPIVELTTKSEPVYIMGSYVGTGEVASVNLGGVSFTGNSTAGREADVRPTGFFFQMPPQREWVGLTSEEREEIMDNLEVHGTRLWEGQLHGFAEEVEAKLKEKNT